MHTFPSASTVVILCRRLGNMQWAPTWRLSPKTEEPAERGESALKEVKWHYKDNSIRLWKMFLTKSETQWSVVLRLIKSLPRNNQSFSLSLALICPLCLNLVPSLFLAQTHVTHAYAHTHTHTHIEGFRRHQSQLDPCMQSSANCGSMWAYPPTFLWISMAKQPEIEFGNDQERPSITVSPQNLFMHSFTVHEK